MKVRHSDEAETRHRRKDANHIGMKPKLGANTKAKAGRGSRASGTGTKPKLGTNTKVKVRHRNEAESRHRHIDANQA